MKYSKLFLVLVGGMLFVLLLSYLPAIVSPLSPDPVRLSKAFDDGISRIRLFLVVVCLFIFWLFIFLLDTNKSKKNKTKAGWAFLMTAVIVMGVNFFVNPRGLYPIHWIEARVENSRKIKADLYHESAKDQQIIILGSSRAYSFSPSYIQESLNYSAFNFSVLNGRLVDSVIISNFVFDHASVAPDLFIIEVSPFGSYEPSVSLTNTSSAFLPYMDKEWMLEYFRMRAEGLLSAHHFSEAIYAFFYHVKFSESPLPWLQWEVFADGGASRPINPYFEETMDLKNESEELLCSLEDVDLQTVYLTRLAQHAEENGTSVIFIMTPWQPGYYQSVLADSGTYHQCVSLYDDIFLNLQSQFDGIYYRDYSDISEIKGNATALGFYDQQHMTPMNANFVIDALSSSINEVMVEKP